MTKIALNGVGRIGKLAVRLLLQNNYNLIHLNERNGDTKSLIHSLEFDSIHGKWDSNFQEDKTLLKSTMI